MLLRWIKTS
jgi:hypothetical protein